ncbi:hypothetical protein Tco_0069053, partial [Tanacetum coccineum]
VSINGGPRAIDLLQLSAAPLFIMMHILIVLLHKTVKLQTSFYAKLIVLLCFTMQIDFASIKTDDLRRRSNWLGRIGEKRS